MRTGAPAPRSYAVLASPIGDLLVVGDGIALTGVYVSPPASAVRPDWTDAPARFGDVAAQLAEYFAGPCSSWKPPSARGRQTALT